MQLVFRCANDTLVTDITSALAIPSAARNLIAAEFIALISILDVLKADVQVGCAQVGRATCQATLSTRFEGLRRSPGVHIGVGSRNQASWGCALQPRSAHRPVLRAGDTD